MSSDKISNGANDRPKDASIAQTAPGLPDDGSAPVDVSEAEVERMRQKLTGGDAREKLLQEVQEEIDLPVKGSA